MSWLDQVSLAAQDDLDGLVNAVLPLSETMLAKHDEFFPYGAAMSIGGDIRLLAGWTGDEEPRPTDLETLYEEVRANASDTRAAVFVSDVRMTELDCDAVRMELEHREGVALVVLRPYRLIDGGVEYEDLMGQSGVGRIWAGFAPWRIGATLKGLFGSWFHGDTPGIDDTPGV